MADWLNIQQLHEKTGIPSTTIRRYISNFPTFFNHRGGTRSRRYEDSGVKVLIRIKQLFEDGYESEEVTKTLQSEFSVVFSGENQVKDEGNTYTPTLVTVEDVAEIKQALAEQKKFNKLLMQKLEDQNRFIRESLENRDQLLLEKFNEKKDSEIEEKEEAARPAEEKKKGFFQKFFKK